MTPEFVRLSIGIEDVRDIIADLDQALKASQSMNSSRMPPTKRFSTAATASAQRAGRCSTPQPSRSHEPLALELGEQLAGSHRCLRDLRHGSTPQRDNAVLVCHALSGDSHVARHDAGRSAGWWDIVVGPGKAIDTDRYFVICPNMLGGCRGTTGPNSINPATGRRYATDFPVVTVGDIVEVQRRLLDHLGIERLHAVVGGSLGGHAGPDLGDALCPTACAARAPSPPPPRLTSQALAFDVVGRNAILRDPDYHERPLLRTWPAGPASVWPSRGCSATSPTFRGRR